MSWSAACASISDQGPARPGRRLGPARRRRCPPTRSRPSARPACWVPCICNSALPLGEPATGRLPDGATIPLNRSSTYPSTEQTLASLAAVVNGGGLGQIGDMIHSFNDAFTGARRTSAQLLGTPRRLRRRCSMTSATDIIATLTELNRLADRLAGQKSVITEALQQIPPALDVLSASSRGCPRRWIGCGCSATPRPR